MERGEQPRPTLTWVGFWEATKTELTSYASDLSVVRFPFALVVLMPLSPSWRRWNAHQRSQIFAETEAYFSLGPTLIGSNHRQNFSYTIA
jgi:hypothetical protein